MDMGDLRVTGSRDIRNPGVVGGDLLPGLAGVRAADE